MNKTCVTILIWLFSTAAIAGAPTCYSSHGGYCQYDGLVETIYVNKYNQILLYFDTAMAGGEAAKAGLGSVRVEAALVNISAHPEFAKLFYSTALSAQATGRAISLQMHNTHQGYLEADRIWLSKP